MATPLIPKATRKKIIEQSLREIDFARRYKAPIIAARWHPNENMYYGVKPPIDDKQRANVMLPKMQGFVDTLLSKVDAPPKINYRRGEEADLKKEKRLNALKDADSRPTAGNWAFKDLLGKKQAILYGRAIYEYHANSLKGIGYASHLTNVDVYDFLIDPSAGGLDIEKARYLGRTGIYKTVLQLREGADEGNYIKREVLDLIGGKTGQSEEAAATTTAGNGSGSEEDRNKENRYASLKVDGRQRVIEGQHKFWEWYTTYEGKRYYVLLHEDSGIAIKMCELTDMFASGLYPFWTWATNPDLAEFWTPSPCDAVREIFMSQSVIINQYLDNNEAINKPMKAYDMDAIANPSMLKYRRDGSIPFKRGTNLNQSLQIIKPDAIQNNERIYNLLEIIGQTESGVTAAAKGVANEETVRIYQGNLANVADRLGLMNHSYSNGYQRFALLYKYGVEEHLNKKTAIRMIGIDGIEFEEVSKSDIMPDNKDFDIYVEASDAEQQLDLVNKKNKITFLSTYKDSANVNQKALFEIQAEINEISADDIRRLLDVDNYGDAELMSEAAADIQKIINGEKVDPNQRATIAYVQKLVNYLRDKWYDMDADTRGDLVRYIDSLRDIVVRNTVQKANEFNSKAGAGIATVEDLNPPPYDSELTPVAPIPPKAM